MEYYPTNFQYSGKTEYRIDFDEKKQINTIDNDDLYTLLHIDLGGYVGEYMYLDSDPFQYASNQETIMKSSDLNQYYNIYEKEFETRNLKSRNESSVSFIKNNSMKQKK